MLPYLVTQAYLMLTLIINQLIINHNVDTYLHLLLSYFMGQIL
jgi:hypothetical protein